MEQIQVLVIDLGSQYTLVIGRTLRELGYRSAILSPVRARNWLKVNKPKAIILSGGSASVYEPAPPTPPTEILFIGIPVLGICYGMQWMTHAFSGRVGAGREKKEYGKTEVTYHDPGSGLFSGINGKGIVWANHGDSVDKVPDGFSILAKSSNGQTIAAIGNEKKKMWGLQFHPEVTQTDKGKDILHNFLSGICNCQTD